MAQRSKDIAGLIGQVRGFDLDGFISDYEEQGPLAWAIGETAWVSKKDADNPDTNPEVVAAPLMCHYMAAAGAQPSLKVLYVPDYVAMSLRVTTTSLLYRELTRQLPSWNVQLALAEGPFEDDSGVGAHFDKDSVSGHPPSKAVGRTTVDLHSSVIKLARHAMMHQPKMIIGEGQGALVAAAYAKPLCLEQSMMTRNVQPEEAGEIGQSWGNVSAIILIDPRMSKKGLQTEKLQAASPALFSSDFPVPPRRTFAIKNRKSIHYKDTAVLYEQLGAEICEGLGAMPLDQLASMPADLA